MRHSWAHQTYATLSYDRFLKTDLGLLADVVVVVVVVVAVTAAAVVGMRRPGSEKFEGSQLWDII
jgi:hypothetical protein